MPTKDAVEVAIGSPRCPALHDAGSRGPRQLFGLWRILRARRPMLPCGLARPRVSRSVAPGPRFPRIIPSLLSRYKGEGESNDAGERLTGLDDVLLVRRGSYHGHAGLEITTRSGLFQFRVNRKILLVRRKSLPFSLAWLPARVCPRRLLPPLRGQFSPFAVKVADRHTSCSVRRSEHPRLGRLGALAAPGE